MNDDNSNANLEDILDSFIMEKDTGRDTLLRYLRDYPQFVADLLDLSREMTLGNHYSNEQLSSSDESLIATAWKRHVKTVPGSAADPLGSLQPLQLNQLSTSFDLPRQVFSALRERRVIASSISDNFLQTLAERVGCNLQHLVDSLNESPRIAIGVSRKSEVKAAEPQKVPFEQILIDAEIDSDYVAELISGK